MGKLLVRLFVKNAEDINDQKVRASYGFLSGMVGIVCNIILFVLKIILGSVSGSVSIVSDAFNNLSDCGNCIITLFGYKLAAKPADRDHPFGHGRLEYIVSLILASIIIVVGFNLFKESAVKIIHPEEITFSWFVAGALIFSILVKLWMGLFNRFLGKRINSPVMLATSKDSFGDTIATFATLISLFMSLFTKLPVDGIMGCIVSGIVLYAGFGIIKETVDELIGKPADTSIVSNIKEIMMEDEQVIGVHDLIIHAYGPGVIFGSVHAEVDASRDIMEVHDAIDILEKKVYDAENVMLTIHMDPVDINNQETNSLKEMMAEIIDSLGEGLSFHDFRVVSGPTHTNLVFDVVLPYESKLDSITLRKRIQDELDKKERMLFAVINVDRDYV